jgi:hypothetical protein
MPLFVVATVLTATVVGVAYAVITSGADAELLGWLAAALTLMTFSMRSMLALRVTALGANAGFITYAALMELMPVLALHLLLVPCNAVRLGELIAEQRRSGSPGLRYLAPERALRLGRRLWINRRAARTARPW